MAVLYKHGGTLETAVKEWEAAHPTFNYALFRSMLEALHPSSVYPCLSRAWESAQQLWGKEGSETWIPSSPKFHLRSFGYTHVRVGYAFMLEASDTWSYQAWYMSPLGQLPFVLLD